jgi:glucose/mannose-6-phosphate isomerase
VISLEDPAALRAADPSGMLDALIAFPDDCAGSYDRGRRTGGLPQPDHVRSLTLCGMGGSAVAGDIVRALFSGRLGVPIDIVRSPSLPEHCETQSVVVVASYSGNTAETLGCLEEAVARGCRVVAVTSGGRLAERCADERLPVVRVPGGMQPRAALGHLAFGTLGALEAAGLVPSVEADVEETVSIVRKIVAALGPEAPRNLAKEIAYRIGDRVPVIWGAEGIGAVAAMRWKTQINENAKWPAFWSAMPELDHNEIVGWSEGAGAGFFLVMLRHDGEDPGVAPRFPLSLEAIRGAGLGHEEVRAAGESPLARLISLVVVGDFTSVYLALRRGVDPTPVEAIDRLKRALG